MFDNSASIVIPTFNRKDSAFNLAKSIRKLKPEIEIIIIEQEAKNVPDQVALAQYKIGYENLKKANGAVAKNKGIALSSGDVVIFFDDDVEVTKETIDSHIRSYENPQIVGVAGRVINDGEYIPPDMQLPTGMTNMLGLKFLYQFWSTKRQEVDFVYGCNMSFRREKLIKMGGFDIRFDRIFDEVDMSWRIRREGKIIFEPRALVLHHKAPSGGIRQAEKDDKQSLIFRSYGLYLAKNILFPLSIISLIVRTKTALSMSSSVMKNLYDGYLQGFTRNTS